MKHPAAYINFEIYEDAVRCCGIASVQLPSIAYQTITISGAGLMGNIEVPVLAMIDNMTCIINWLEPTGDAINLMTPERHQIDCRVASEKWVVEDAEIAVQADKYVILIRPKNFNPGTIAPMSAADTSGEYVVYYLAAYKDGVQLYEIDKQAQKFVVNGVDYYDDIARALALR